MNQESYLSRCELCPRRCRVNRLAGQSGRCGAGHVAEVFRYGAHVGEEPPISGTRGSGTVFFSRCALECVYCQNYPWSQQGKGDLYREEDLALALRDLAQAGCHNWNLVSPTPWLPLIRKALEAATYDGISLPVVYNTSGFESVTTLREFGDLADIFLTDLRYSRNGSAEELSDAAGYVETARAALLEMWSRAGPIQVDSEGVAVSGTICRLLILPGHAQEVIENLEWLSETIGTEIAISVMAQYAPAYKAVGLGQLDRRITEGEYAAVQKTVERLGFACGWIQETGQATDKALLGFEMAAGAGVKA